MQVLAIIATIPITTFLIPNDGTFEILLNDFQTDQVILTVTDISGRKLFQQTISKGKLNPHKVVLQNMVSGVYYATAQSRNRLVIERIVVQ